MARYITTDTTTGEIVHQGNRHPLTQQLATRRPKRRLSLPEAWEALELKGKAFIIAAAVLTLLTL